MPAKSLAETAKEKTALSEATAIVEVEVVALTAPLLLIMKYARSVEVEFQAIFKVVMATRQPSEDKEFWHSEMVKEEIAGGTVSGAEEELLELDDDDSLEEPASDEEDEAGKLDEEDSLAELAADEEEDEPASSAGKLEEELSATPVPPPPKPG